jgi:hypothetical protein
MLRKKKKKKRARQRLKAEPTHNRCTSPDDQYEYKVEEVHLCSFSRSNNLARYISLPLSFSQSFNLLRCIIHHATCINRIRPLLLFSSRIHHHVRCAPSTREKAPLYLSTTREYRSPPSIISHPERPGHQKKTRQLFSFEISVLDGYPSASILMGEALLLAACVIKITWSDGTTGTTRKKPSWRDSISGMPFVCS